MTTFQALHPPALSAPGSVSIALRPRGARVALACAVACVLGAWLMLAASPAAATVVHQSEGSFNGSDRPAHEPFSWLLPSVAADRSSGDVWVTEESFGTGAVKVDKFNAKGEYAGVEITGAGTPHGEFGLEPFSAGIAAVDNTASGPHKGDLYLSDTEHGVVDRFSGSGVFECQITGRTPGTVEEITHECNGAAGSEPTGGPAGIEPSGLAVDSAGDLYVADKAHNVIDVFGPNGEYKQQIASSHLGEGVGLGTIALDSSGDLYVANISASIVEFNPSGDFVKVIDEGNTPSGVAVDPSDGRVYVGVVRENPTTKKSEDLITEYEPSGTLLDVFAPSSTGEFTIGYLGLAVGPSGKVYADEPFIGSGAGHVVIYSPDTVVPNVTTQAATGLEESSATMHGHIDQDAAHGGGEVTSCRFEYGPTTAYGETALCTPAPPYSSPQEVSASVTGLRPASTYHFRLEAANSNGISSVGEDQALTAAGAPSVDQQSAEALTNYVTFKAKIDPWGYETTCMVQYVTAAIFQESEWANATTVPCPKDLGHGFGDVTVRFKVRGLARATIYHYRVLATNQAGLAGHSASTFETYGIRKFSVEFLKNSNISFPGGSDFWQPGEPEVHQAGAHPYELVTDVIFSHTTEFSKKCEEFPYIGCEELEIVNNTAVNTKDIQVELPAGLIGNPTALPKCNRALVSEHECPSDTQVGVAEIWVDFPLARHSEVWPLPEEKEGESIGARQYTIGIYNLEPTGQAPAEFGGFIEGQAPVWIPFHVRTGSDYGVSADSIDITSIGGGISRVRTRVWGVPASPAHEAERQSVGCPGARPGHCPDTESEVPFLRNPTSCTGPLTVTASADTWQEPVQYVQKSTEIEGFTGCGKLKFEPTLEAQPTTNVADSPSGLDVDLHVPQNEEPGSLATADLKDAKITLPAGVTVDPSSADGLAACSEVQIGYLPQKSAEVGHPQFTPGPAECPDASKVGSVEVDSSLVDHPLLGAVYLAAQDANPFKSLLALYITIYDAQTGVVVKLPGKVTADPVTGRLTTSIEENPQLPFNDFKLDLFSGSRATLTTPLTCGSYSVSTDLTPWSTPEGKDAEPSSLPFSVTGLNGAACVSSEAQAPNTPGFEAGTASPIAASYSPFVLHLKREDGSQRFSGLNVTLPPGLIGKIAGVAQCPQASIEAAMARGHEREGASELAHPSCPAGSEVGVVHVGAGSGAPYFVTGHAYFAGPYKGAPFSLVIVTPAVAGPFDLGTVVVRAGLYIDPNTAQVTVKSDPLPTILDGIPLDIRSIAVEMNRKEFTFNPTSCSVMSVTGQEPSTAGQTAALSDRFQAGGCTTLPFHPVLTASTQANASRADGASLLIKVTAKPGQEANVAKTDLLIPSQLPARLTTLRLACTAAQFEANPANCPKASDIGTASVQTPLLSVPLTGPMYIVGHGGAAFPDIEIVLQGEGVEIVLDGKTDIKNGITYSNFETIPDTPFSSFEADLGQGPYSILGTNLPASAKYNLCGQKLKIPTTLTGQNGATFNQDTAVSVTGCSTTALSITSHSIKKRTLTLTVAVPGAGELRVSGKGLRSKALMAKGQETLTVTVKQKQAGKLKTTVKILFTPSKGKTQSKTLNGKFNQ